MNGLPTFIGVGVGKCGSSWLHVCLDQHPEVFMPKGEEINFFSRHYENGFDWYKAKYNGADKYKIIGDISPSYVVSIPATERIHAFNPNCRIIFQVRDPIQRLYSNYYMLLRGNKVSDDIDTVMSPENPTTLVNGGLYFTHLTRFLGKFPREQILVQFYEDLSNDPLAYYQQTCRFIGADPSFIPPILNKKYHVRRPRPRSQRLFQFAVSLSTRLGKNNLTRPLVTYARSSWIAASFHRFNKGKPFPKLSQSAHQRLVDYYSDDVIQLAKFTNRNLDHWLIEKG
jgi:hypothetical protein